MLKRQQRLESKEEEACRVFEERIYVQVQTFQRSYLFLF